MKDERPQQISTCHPCFPLHNESHWLTELSSRIPLDNNEELESQLQTCLDEISLVKLHLQRLERRKTSLETQLTERQSLLSPLHKIPTEIWREIFTLCVPNNSLSVSQTRWNKVEAIPYVLSHVCSRWRGIIDSFPGLWSSVHANLYALNRDITPLLESYFSRSSKGRGSHVLVQFRKGSGVNGRGDWVEWSDQGSCIESLREGPWTKYADAAYKCILANSEIMKGLDVRDIAERNPVGRLCFPLIETLTVKDRTVPSWLNDAITTAPNLRYLDLDVRGNASHLESTTATISEAISYSQIRTLRIDNLAIFHRGYMGLLDILPTLRNLKTLSVDVDGVRSSISNLSPAKNETLKSLTLTSKLKLSTTIHPILDSLDLPSLESLDLSGCGPQKLTTESFNTFERFSFLRNLSLSVLLDNSHADEHARNRFDDICGLFCIFQHLESLDLCVKGTRGLEGSFIPNLFSSFAEERNAGMGRELKELSITEGKTVLTAEMVESIVTNLERRSATLNTSTRSRLQSVCLVFGGYRHSDLGRMSGTVGRLRELENKFGASCEFWYTSWGLKSFVFGPKGLEE